MTIIWHEGLVHEVTLTAGMGSLPLIRVFILQVTFDPSDENQITCVALKNPESYKYNFIRSETINK